MPKIVRFHHVGDASVLKLEELPKPQPKEGEVLLKVEAIGLNRAEVMFRSGKYLYQPNFPSLIGYEASGIVEAVGPGVTGLKPGDRVSSIPSFSMTKYGTYGEYAVLPAHALAPYPANLSPVVGTAIWMQYITAYGVVEVGGLKKGQHLLITAAASTVGLAAIQTAKAVGAISIATTRNKAKVSACQTWAQILWSTPIAKISSSGSTKSPAEKDFRSLSIRWRVPAWKRWRKLPGKAR